MDRMSGQGWPCPPHAHTCLPMAMAKGRTLGTDKETAQVYTVGHVLRICRAVHMSAPSSGSRLEPKNKKYVPAPGGRLVALDHVRAARMRMPPSLPARHLECSISQAAHFDHIDEIVVRK